MRYRRPARRVTRKVEPLRDHVVTFKGRYLTGSLTASQYTDLIDYAAKTTEANAKSYEARGPEYKAVKL